MRRVAIVVGAAVVSHWTALRAGFVWLDHAHIEDGGAVMPLGRLLDLFTRGFAGTGYYRPLMGLSLSLDAHVGGATAFHVTSVFWHAVAAVMTMLAGEALGLARRAALFGALVFAVHPLSALVAGAIAFRSEAIVTAALLGLIWAHRRERPVAAAVAVAVGALTKETALVLAPLFVLALQLGRKRSARRPALALLLAETSALAVALLLRFFFAPAWRAGYASLAFGDAVGTRLAAVAKSAAAVLVVERSICDAFTITHWWQPTSLAGLLVLSAVAFAAWKRRGMTLLLALSLLPALQLVPIPRWWSPHYLYLPFAFVAMHAGMFAERLAGRWLAATVVVASLLGGITLFELRRYRDDYALWAPEVKRLPACREGQFYLGEVERAARRWEPAALRYEAALAERPDLLAFVDRGAALQNLGTVRFEQKRFADARRAYAEALAGAKEERRRRELTHNLAGAALADGDAAEAARLLAPECARPDAFRVSLEVQAAALRRLGREDEARVLFERAAGLP